MNATKCTHYAGTDTCSGTGALEYGGGWYCQRCYAALRDHEDRAYGGASVIDNPDPLVSLLLEGINPDRAALLLQLGRVWVAYASAMHPYQGRSGFPANIEALNDLSLIHI